MKVTLTLIATPIGNLSDLSPRAVKTLEESDVVACEDTRRTGLLLQHFGITGTRMLRVDSHTEDKASAEIINCLSEGLSVSMVTDAGMPSVSDPGERLVKKVIESGYQVTVVPGPTAPISALVVSGFSTQRWCMEGFLPRKGESRSKRIKEVADEDRTVILFESPNRLASTLEDLRKECGNTRQVAIVRELTKLHEEIFRGSLEEALLWSKKTIKGEIVVVLEADTSTPEIEDEHLESVLREILKNGASTKDAAEEASRRLNVSRRRAYSTALDLRAE
ncbi:MAG TPA: 16S rRNA (cytidine(1402)-2'-O)-methyltransferase [Acidimicrobiales bacterium]|nr:16S rRNA (cytidine(1402)-2'-O)-methyltransferase [Acidimicrobiales bacterium]|tara:strand:- start:583 stop:1416 length:834 start_codon:yes stop_codon:yes gene_type:complete